MKISKHYNSKRKKYFDLIASIILLCILTPIFIISYPFLVHFIKKPVIFKQKRVGKNKKIFTIYKIRTMKIGSEKKQKKLLTINQAPYPMFKVNNDPRFTKIGKYLSQLGIDELPQLINIIKGEMSLVGPRPLPVKEAQKLDNTWSFRYAVKPGILSKWALSPKRYQSLNNWKELEKKGLKNGSFIEDVFLTITAIDEIILKKILTFWKDTSI